MNSFFTQVSSSIRILGWNRDASARATHLKAAGGNVPSATIERKSMSTKTSIKRIALVAAAALTIGGFSAVSAHAAASTLTQVAGTGDNGAGGIAGPANTLQVLVTHATSSAEFVSITGGTILSASNSNTVATNGLSVLLSRANATDTLTIATPSAGSLVVNAYDEVTAGSGTFPSTVTTTKTITISAAGISGVYSAAKSSAYITAGRAANAVALTADDASAVIASSATTGTDTSTIAATIQVTYLDGNGAAIKNANDTLTATITSGPGIIGGVVDSVTSSLTAALTTSANTYSVNLGTNQQTGGIYSFGIWANKQVGTTVVSIKNAAGTVIATKSLVFYSTTPASVTAKVLKAYVLNSNTPTNKVFSLVVSDAGGNPIAGLTPTMAVATGSTVGVAGTCAWNGTDLVYYCTAAASTTTAAVTTADASETYTFTAGTATTTASVKFVSGVLTTVSVDGPASADPGTKVTYTLTALGANGSPLPDGAYKPGAILVGGPTSNVANAAAIAFDKTETITLAGGTATDYTYAPFSGTLASAWTVVGTASTAGPVSYDSGLDAFTTAGVAKALAATTVTADDVAVTANTDATAAANAATDAANAAADAADQATAAVTELQTQVVALIAAIQKQITALTVLITKIKNKVKA